MNKTVNFDAVGELIKMLREEKGMDQNKLAKALNVSSPAVCLWESGGNIKTENLFDIAMFFNITVQELLDGKLKKEHDENYFARNYDLDNHPNFLTIDEQNIGDLKEYLIKSKKVINRFFRLILNEMIGDYASFKTNDEIGYLVKYFNIDYNYLNYIGHSGDPDDAITDILNNKSLSETEKLYELSKIFSFKLDANSMSIVDYGEETSIKLLLDVLNDAEKDQLFTQYLQRYDEFDDMEFSPVISLFLESNAHILYTGKPFEKAIQIDYEDLNEFEGKIIEENSYNVAKSFLSPSIDEPYEFTQIIHSWKALSLKDYGLLINRRETEYLYLLLNFKDENPLKYYDKIQSLFGLKDE